MLGLVPGTTKKKPRQKKTKSSRRHSIAHIIRSSVTSLQPLKEEPDPDNKNSFHWAAKHSVAKVKKNKIHIDNEADEQYDSMRRDGRIVFRLETADYKNEKLSKYLIPPEAWWRPMWDITMSLLVFYYAVVTPINMSFAKSPLDLIEIEIIFNAFFVMDIILSKRTKSR